MNRVTHLSARKSMHFLCAGFSLYLMAQFVALAPAFGMEKQVLVTLFRAHGPRLTIYVAGPARILTNTEDKLAAGLYSISAEDGKFNLRRLDNKQSNGHRFQSRNLRIIPDGSFLRLGVAPEKLRRYRGEIQVYIQDKSIVCKNLLAMRNYVTSVVGSETLSQFPKEALKAQSVLAQSSMARYKLGDELNDSTEKQAYLGADYERKSVLDAVQQTWGQTLSFENRPVPIFFHSCCAGGSSSSEYFTGKKSGLACDKAVKCNFCKDSNFWKETTHIVSAQSFQAKFPDGLPSIAKRDEFGRPITLEYKNGKTDRAYNFWLKFGQDFGWDKMPGTRFDTSLLANGDVRVNSRGAGHGVGLCQWGACGMARKNFGYKKILEFYYPGAVIKEQVNRN